MKAAYLTGILEPLIVKEIPTPHPAENNVLVRLAYSALNHRDLWMVKGMYSGPKSDLIMGSDGCGVVEAVGPGVESSLIGQEVVINPSMNWGPNPAAFGQDFKILGNPEPGTFAEYVSVDRAYVYPQPAHLTGPEAAALPLAGLTVFRALFTRARLTAGEKVLVTGIGAGTASLALQFALAAGAEVYVTSGSPEKILRAKELGARDGLDYNDATWPEKFKERIGGFDVIIDSASGKNFERLIEAAARGGRIAFFGATGGVIGDILPRKIFWNNLSLLGTTMGTPEEFEDMLRFVSKHHLKPIVDKVFPSLHHLQDALEYMSKGHQFGKIVLRNQV
jgi:zinc-binding alcohol dehydrogenase/oxidoreductase